MTTLFLATTVATLGAEPLELQSLAEVRALSPEVAQEEHPVDLPTGNRFAAAEQIADLGAHDHADEPGRSREPGVRHREQHHERAEHWHRVDHATVVGDHPAVQSVVHDADAEEQRAGDEAVRNHLDHRTFDREHGTMWGGASHFGEDYGIAW